MPPQHATSHASAPPGQGSDTMEQPQPVLAAARQRMVRLLRQASRATLDLLLPPHCPACQAPVTSQGSFCPSCFGALHFITPPLCHSCGLPFASAQAGGRASLCPACREAPPPWRDARAALQYNPAAAGLLTSFKHQGREELAAILAPFLARAGQTLLERAELIIPVPLHASRLRQRGFNQSARLAQRLAAGAAKPALLDALRRVRETQMLGPLNAAARAAELAGTIILADRHAHAIHNRRILLVDDVLTSGATAGACTRALLAGGAASVDLLLAARVPDPRAY